MGKSLYALENQWVEAARKVADNINEETGEIPADLVDWLEATEVEIDQKIEAWAVVIEEKEAFVTKRKERNRILYEAIQVEERQIDSMKKKVVEVMKLVGKPKIKTDLFTISIANNGGAMPVKVTGDVPKDYQFAIWKNDTDKIREVLQSGQELPFAVLGERGQHLRIK